MLQNLTLGFSLTDGEDPRRWRFQGIRVFAASGAPAPSRHVECTNGGEILVLLGDGKTAPSLWQNHHMKVADARDALRIVEENQQRFLTVWRRLHG